MSDQADYFFACSHDPREWDKTLADMFWKTFLFRPILGHPGGILNIDGTYRMRVMYVLAECKYWLRIFSSLLIRTS